MYNILLLSRNTPKTIFKSAPDIDLNMYIINVIADDESKVGLYEIYF